MRPRNLLRTRGRRSSGTFSLIPHGVIRGRLPSNWRDRLSEAASVYRKKLNNLSPPDRDGWAVAPCPFHGGDERALAVDLAGRRGGWRCSACGAHGDLVAFVRELEGLSFPAAVRALMEAARRYSPSATAEAHIRRCRALLAGED